MQMWIDEYLSYAEEAKIEKITKILATTIYPTPYGNNTKDLPLTNGVIKSPLTANEYAKQAVKKIKRYIV